MKIKRILQILLPLAILLVIGAVNVWVQYNRSFDSPKESFLKSAPKDAVLLNIVEGDDVAMIIYKTKDSYAMHHIVFKGDHGWTSFNKPVFTSKNTMSLNGNGTLFIWTCNDQKVVTLYSLSKNSELEIQDDSRLIWKGYAVSTPLGYMHYCFAQSSDNLSNLSVRIK